MWRHWLSSITNAVPGQCLVCRAWPSQPLCEDCVVRHAQPYPRCRTCAMPAPHGMPQCGACLRHPPPLDACVAAVRYAFPWSRLIVAFKFHAEPGMAGSLAHIMRSAPWVEPSLEAADVVLPMPLSTQRLRMRGYNQSWLLARQLAPHKADAGLLLRVRDTLPQSSLSRTERMRNMRRAFIVEPLRSTEVAGAHVAIVDDVMTSGASLHAAALALREAGARRVTGLVLARAEVSDPGA